MCNMFVSRTEASLICTWLVLPSTSCSGEEAGVAKKHEAVSYLQEKLAKSVAAFGEKVEECGKQAQTNTIEVLDKAEL